MTSTTTTIVFAWVRWLYPCRKNLRSAKVQKNDATEAKLKMAKLVVVGGTGFVGTRVVRAALSQGLRVASVSRSGKLIADDPTLAGAEFLAADVEDKESLRRVLDGADAVVSCLGAHACPTKRLGTSSGVLAIS